MSLAVSLSWRCLILLIFHACSNWCREQGLIVTDPFAEVSVPKGGRRERILTEAERKEILVAIRDREFREFVFAMQSTGCRPGEVRSVTAAEINFEVGLWVITKHKTANKTGKPRIVLSHPGNGRSLPHAGREVSGGSNLPK